MLSAKVFKMYKDGNQQADENSDHYSRLFSLHDFFDPDNILNVTNKPFYREGEESNDFESTNFYELQI